MDSLIFNGTRVEIDYKKNNTEVYIYNLFSDPEREEQYKKSLASYLEYEGFVEKKEVKYKTLLWPTS
jgi:hypothetical protein